MAEFLAATAAQAGLDVEFQAVAPGRSNLLARLSPRGKVRQRLLLAPHLDTVNATDEQFTPRTRNGRLFGRGACDTKGSVAAMLTALCELAQGRQRPAETEIVFAGLVDEEHGQAGSRALVASGFRADLAIVGEPTRSQVVTAHKGTLWMRLETRGKSAHGSWPGAGAQRRPRDGPGGGSAGNGLRRAVAPPAASAAGLRHGERRRDLRRHAGQHRARPLHHPDGPPHACPARRKPSVRREIARLAAPQAPDRGLREGQAASLPAAGNGPEAPAGRAFPARAWASASRSACVTSATPRCSAHGGIPSVVFGPGDIAQAHTADEWISLAALERGKELLLRFLQSFS